MPFPDESYSAFLEVSTMTGKSFSVRIFFQEGHADGVLVLAKSKWSGRCLVIPRASLAAEKKRPELNTSGLYILVGPSTENNLASVYIGEADPLWRDLQRHDAEKSFWDRAIVFASKDGSLNGTQIQYLASRLVKRAKESKNAHLDNVITPEFPELSATELSDAEAFLAHMLSVLPLLGLRAFERPGNEKIFESVGQRIDRL
jgi:hypothetical protein